MVPKHKIGQQCCAACFCAGWNPTTSSADVLDESAGEEIGPEKYLLAVSGNNTYGWLQAEAGVHRLVRIFTV